MNTSFRSVIVVLTMICLQQLSLSPAWAQEQVKQDLSSIHKQLQNPDATIRRQACEALVNHKASPAALVCFRLAFNDQDLSIQATACQFLQNNQAQLQLHLLPLLERTQSQSPKLSEAAVKTIAKAVAPSPAQIPEVARVLANSKVTATKLATLRLLAKAGNKAQATLARLFATLNDKESSVRESAAVAIRKIGVNAGHIGLLTNQLRQNKSLTTRRLAAELCFGLKKAAAPALEQLKIAAKDADTQLSQQAKKCLAIIEKKPGLPRAVIQSLSKQLRADDSDKRLAAIRKTVSHGALARPLLPKLLALLDDSNYQVRSAAESACLSVSASVNELTILKDTLSDSDSSDQRLMALKLIQRLRSKASGALKEILQALADNNYQVRSLATTILDSLRLKSTRHIPVLRDGLRDDDSDVRLYSLKLLTNYGRQVQSLQPRFLKLLSDSSSSIRTQARSTIPAVGFNASQIDFLRKTAKDNDDYEARLFALKGLVSCVSAKDEALSELFAALSDNSSTIRTYARQQLAKVTEVSDAKLPFLAKKLSADDYEVRLFCLKALGAAGSKAQKYQSKLLKMLSDSSSTVRTQARKTIPRVGFSLSQVDMLKELSADDDDYEVRLIALKALVKLQTPSQILPQLLRALNDSSSSIRTYARDRLARTRSLPESRMSFLVKKLKSDDYEVRVFALKQLAQYKAKARKLLKGILPSLDDSSSTVREQAEKTVAAIGFDSSHLELLNDYVSNDSQYTIRLLAIKALGDLRPKAISAVPTLLAVLNDDSSTIREAASKALESLKPFTDVHLTVFVKNLTSSSYMIRKYSLSEIASFGPAARPYQKQILKLLKDDYSAIRESAEKVSRKVGFAEKQIPLLREFVQVDNYYQRQFAIKALKRFGTKAYSAIPELLAAQKDDYSQIRSLAETTAMAVYPGGKSQQGVILKALKSEHYHTQMLAFKLLAKADFSTTDLLEPLFHSLKNDYSAIANLAQQNLDKLSLSSSHVTFLSEKLSSNAYKVKLQALKMLESLRGKANPALRSVLLTIADDYSVIANQAAKTLAVLGKVQSQDQRFVHRQLKHSSYKVKLATLALLTRQADPQQSFFPAFRSIADDYSVVRNKAIETCQAIGVTSAEASKLGEYCSAENYHLQLNALKFLSQLGTKARPQCPEIIAAIGDDYSVVSNQAKSTLAAIKPTKAQLNDLLAGLKSSQYKVCLECLIQLAKLGNDARPALFKIMKPLTHDYSVVRNEALKTLLKIGVTLKQLPGLIDRVRDKNYRIRHASLKLIGTLGTQAKTAKLPISELNYDPYSLVRKQLLETLKQIDNAKWGTTIANLNKLFDSDPDEQKQAAEALQFDPNAPLFSSYLIDGLVAKTPAVRVAILKALNEIGHGERDYIFALSANDNAKNWALKKIKVLPKPSTKIVNALKSFWSNDKNLAQEARKLLKSIQEKSKR